MAVRVKMPKAPLAKIVKGALDGVVKAHKAYMQWSGGGWLWEAPEYMTTIFVAQEIAMIDGAKYVTLEHSAKGAINDAGAKGRGKLHSKIRADGKFDMLLWGTDILPRVPIEVKGQVTSITKIRNDLLRIDKALHRKKDASSFEFGMLIFYTALDDSNGVGAKVNLKNSLASIKKACEILLKNCKVGMTSSKIREDSDSAWVASVITLRPRS